MPPETTPAGATPAAEGATPSQTPDQPAAGTTTAAPSEPATGDEGALGESGKRALEAERSARREAEDRAKKAEKERDDLKLATASEADKAIAAARSEGEKAVIERLHAAVRRSAVREALAAAGATPSLVPDLSLAAEFTGLKVGDNDEIDAEELAKAVKAHKARVPDAYTKPTPPAGATGSSDGGAAGSGQPPAKDLESALERHYGGQPA